MAEKRYRATLSKGRSGWCVIFRHPVCKAADGRQALRVRRGLGTRNESEANGLVEQLNKILGDPKYWNLTAKSRADATFEPRVVSAFFDHLTPEKWDGWARREDVLPLPSRDDGYARVQFVGTTGAGKTTVGRQLIGTDPKQERFPSISAAKTTICDMEIIVTEGDYRAVVSFLPRDQIRQYIMECVTAAVAAHLEFSTHNEVVRRFMEHGEQRFRLSYILGHPSPPNDTADEEIEDEDDEESEVDDAEVTTEEQKAFAERLQDFLTRIKSMSRRSREEIVRHFEIDLSKASKQDRDALQEMVEEKLLQDDGFHALVDDILDEVEARFEYATTGELQRGRDGWPQLWTHTTADRKEFIKSVNRFSSNYAPNFGRLLTPLVEGIRVAGPFSPKWHDGDLPKLVLLDGQGIGHTADSTSSISTGITRRFEIADFILLVDNAAQPMQAGPVAVLRTVASSGHEAKLAVAFTHFDEVKGDNLRGSAAKMDHVSGSFFNAVQAIGKALGRDAEQSLRRLIPERLFFLSRAQTVLSSKSRFTLRELNRLLLAIAQSIEPPAPVEYHPVYDVANLILAVQKATQEFHDMWRGILGMGTRSGVAPEHWTRVKALTRRIGILSQDEYDTLRPIADLIRLLQSEISKFLSEPLKWTPGPIPENKDEELTQAIDGIRKQVFTRLHELSNRRLVAERLSGWVEAYEHRGTGSTRVRAKDMIALYESAAPVPNEMPGPDLNEFLFEVRELVAESIIDEGGEIRGWTREPEIV
jgi:ABC-type dipeptide/oligopeptide/nickel transport system ATPase subunit